MDEQEAKQLMHENLVSQRNGRPDPYPDNERQIGVFYNSPVEFIDCGNYIYYGESQDEQVKARVLHLKKLSLYRWMYENKHHTRRSTDYLEKYGQFEDK